ncbi:uncharacterized protein [Ptychodera flava]|uniref:uncharacterized protein n=1 Tax=Ptychodera flava TaxID=63121 RepID=UPI00396AACB9
MVIYKLHLSDNADLDATGAKVSAAIDVTGAPTSVPATADGENTGLTSGMTASVRILNTDGNCAAYDKVCIKVAPDNPVLCISITAPDCSAISVKADTFKITEPTIFKLTTTEDTKLTFDAGLSFDGSTEVAISSYKLHLSDKEDLGAEGAKVSAAIDVTDAPESVPANADGTKDKGLTTGMTATVKILSAEDCSAYGHLCLKVEHGPATGCLDVKDKIECSDSGAGVQRLSLFTALLILMSIVLPFTG